MNIIKVENLTKKYGDFVAVDHVSFEVKKGSLLGFLGVNGAGKTTVINMLATLLVPDEGGAELCGEVLGKGDVQIRKKIGIVYQQNCLDELLNVQENLLCRGIIHGATKAEAKIQCEKLSSILKLEDILKKKYKTLSGGQKRRCEFRQCKMDETLFKHKILFRIVRGNARDFISSHDAEIVSELEDHYYRYSDGLKSVSMRPYLHPGLSWEGWQMDFDGNIGKVTEEEEYLL